MNAIHEFMDNLSRITWSNCPTIRDKTTSFIGLQTETREAHSAHKTNPVFLLVHLSLATNRFLSVRKKRDPAAGLLRGDGDGPQRHCRRAAHM